MGAVAQRPTDRSDHELVGAVRRGDERAFEVLYERYQRRIAAYVRGMVKDPQRAEDITQEVFFSAHRRMRETERPINFKPWLFEIARNASIDAFRRKRRTAEVSYDADGGLAPNDRLRLVASQPGPVEAIGAKEEIEHLTGAFGGLSETHHEILVLRELEGRSYADIGERLGMSRGAVESTLFRARKRLGEEYEELASGRRCERVQSVITEGEVPHLGARDQRKMARHLAHCQSCRRLAALTGVEIPAALPKRAADKLRSLLPVPAWIGRGGDGGVVVQLYAGSGEPLINAWSRAIAALVALAVAGAGVGVQPPGRTQKDAAVASADPEHSARQASVFSPGRGGAAQRHARVTARRGAGRARGATNRRAAAAAAEEGAAGPPRGRRLPRRPRPPVAAPRWRPRPFWPRRPRSRSRVSRTLRRAARSRARRRRRCRCLGAAAARDGGGRRGGGRVHGRGRHLGRRRRPERPARPGGRRGLRRDRGGHGAAGSGRRDGLGRRLRRRAGAGGSARSGRRDGVRRHLRRGHGAGGSAGAVGGVVSEALTDPLAPGRRRRWRA